MFTVHDEVFARDKHGQTQLHKAASTGNMEKVLKFLEKGVDVNIRDHAGWSPLHEAALAGHDEILQLLIEVTFWRCSSWLLWNSRASV